MDALMEEWKKIKDDDKVNKIIVELQNTKYGYLIEELIFEDVTLKNVLHIIQVCIEIIRKVQYTNDHKLISEFLNDNPQIKIVEL
jgi:predicted RNA-binding protein with EMAP domain